MIGCHALNLNLLPLAVDVAANAHAMTWWQSLILGIVEGLTEYLPVSSTGHLILANHLLGLEKSEALDAYDIVVQAGAIVAVMMIFWRRIFSMLKGVVGRDPKGLRLAIHLLVAFAPAAVCGLLVAKHIKQYLFSPGPVMLAAAVGAALIFLFDWWKPQEETLKGKEIEDMTSRDALLIGLAQCLAMWPGTSRSLMTLLALLMLGYRMRVAAEFSFLLGLITLGAATAHDTLKHGHAMQAQLGIPVIAIGLAAALVSAFVSVKWMLEILNSRGLVPFGWYRIVLAAALFGMIVGGWLAW